MKIENLKRAYKTGFPSIDNRFAGIISKDLMVIASRPGGGKSSLAFSLAKGLIDCNNEHIPPTICYFSLEHSREEIYKHWVNLSEELIVEDNTHSIEDICDRITALSQRFGMKVFFIDYYSKMLSLNPASENNVNCAVKLRTLSEELGVAIVCLEEIFSFKPDSWTFGYGIDKTLCEEADTVLVLEKDFESKIQAHWAKDVRNRKPFLLYRMHDGFVKEIVCDYEFGYKETSSCSNGQ